MFKKAVSYAVLTAVLTMIMPASVLAANIQSPGLIQSVTLSVPNGTPQTFEPALNQVLKTAVAFDTANFGAQLSQSTGYAKVISGTTTVKTLTTWTNQALPAAIADWDGKSIDNNAAAQLICGNTNAICPDGDYKIEVRVEYSAGVDKIFDLKTQDFKVFTTPAVAISNFSVTPASFNPLTQTADIAFTTSADGFVTVEILDGATVKKTLINNESLTAGAYSKANKAALAWDGKDTGGVTLGDKAYTVKVTTRKTAAGAILDTKTLTATISTPATIVINTFVVAPTPTKAGNFDPSASGDNQDLQIDYTLNKVADNVLIDIRDPKNSSIKTFNSNTVSGTFTWNGEISSKLVVPGTYKVVITATKAGEASATQSKDVAVVYNNANKGELQNFSVLPGNFDPDFEDVVIEFKNTKDADLTAEIHDSNGLVVRTFSGYQNTNYSANSNHSFAWDGKNTSGSDVSLGSYKVVVVSRNVFGVVATEATVAVNNSGGSVSSSNAHISNISFSPSSSFEPAVDEELKIEFDVEKDLDILTVTAVRGTEKIELYNEEDVEEQNNLEITWDGTDDNDDYVDMGSWKIEFKSKLDATELTAVKAIDIDYEKPEIDDLYLSKEKFDNDLGEFTYVIFRLDSDASVTITELESNDEQDDLAEDMEVEGKKWYAVKWDGDNYGYNDDMDIKIVAANIANENVFDSQKISVDLSEETTSSNKSNVSQDFIDPVVTNGNDEMALYYSLEDTADVTVTIHKGDTSSGSKVIELIDVEDQDGGDHVIYWDGKNQDGKKLSAGLYTYKVVSKAGATETETGLFVVGTVGDVEGSSSGSSSGGSSSGGVGSGVIVDGVASGGEEEPSDDFGNGDFLDKDYPKPCDAFPDVDSGSKHCEAIDWVYESGIFGGYPDGTFREFSPINRAEFLKVLIEAFDLPISPAAGNLGFNDVITGAWYVPYIKLAKDLGVFSGDAGKNTARPEASINRAEALKLTFELFKVLQKYTISGCSVSYPDIKGSDWFSKYACESYELGGLFDAVNGVNFSAGSATTRGEIAEMFYRLHLAGLL